MAGRGGESAAIRHAHAATRANPRTANLARHYRPHRLAGTATQIEASVRVSSHEPDTLRDHIAISDHAVQQDRPEFVRTRAAALEACGFAECSPACPRIL